MKPLIIYHGNCCDGAGSALAAYWKFGEDAEYRAAFYNTDPPTPPEIEGRDVYLLDFSYSREVILDMAVQCNLTVIDHHKTAQTALDGIDGAHFDMDHSGAVLSWVHFHPGTEVPRMLLYMEDRDLWRFKLPASKSINAALKASGCTSDFLVLVPDFRAWLHDEKESSDRTWTRLVGQGDAVVRAEDAMVTAMVKGAEVVELGGQKALCVNATVLFSEVPHQLLQDGPWPMAIVWGWDGKRQRYQVSLRSREGFDCSEVAKQFGGGGHAKAAGFVCDWLPWRIKRGEGE